MKLEYKKMLKNDLLNFISKGKWVFFFYNTTKNTRENAILLENTHIRQRILMFFCRKIVNFQCFVLIILLFPAIPGVIFQNFTIFGNLTYISSQKSMAKPRRSPDSSIFQPICKVRKCSLLWHFQRFPWNSS